MDIKQYKGAVEAMLFAHAEPISSAKLAVVLCIEEDIVSSILMSLKDEYLSQQKGFLLLTLEDRWQLATNPAYSNYVTQVLDNRRNVPISPSAMEILAIIAYNQPVSRSFVEQVRGVDSTTGIQTLSLKGLIEEHGRLDLPGRPIAYKTTDVFLRTFGITSLNQLPSLKSDDYSALELGYQDI